MYDLKIFNKVFMFIDISNNHYMTIVSNTYYISQNFRDPNEEDKHQLSYRFTTLNKLDILLLKNIKVNSSKEFNSNMISKSQKEIILHFLSTCTPMGYHYHPLRIQLSPLTDLKIFTSTKV